MKQIKPLIMNENVKNIFSDNNRLRLSELYYFNKEDKGELKDKRNKHSKHVHYL